MNRNVRIISIGLLSLTLAALSGCSSSPTADDAKKPAIPLQKIQGKVQLVQDASGAGDSSLNPGGPSVFFWEGKHRYRLFPRKSVTLTDGGEYIVEGVNAQKMIDEIGDPAQGKGGYPLLASCERVVKTAWSGMSFEDTDVKAGVLRARVGRYPARPIILVVKMDAVPQGDTKKEPADEEEDLPSVSVPADKQRAALTSGSLVLPAPLWEPAGGPTRCKVIISPEGKVAKLDTGAQLCELFNWDSLQFKPLIQGGKPVRVKSEVEITYEPRK